MPPPEGVIQFRLEHGERAIEGLDVERAFAELAAWRDILRRTGLVGQNQERYDGYAYGNLSVRLGRASAGRGRRRFLITGSQTSGREDFTLVDCAVVERWDAAANRLSSSGRAHPSSESLSHACVYDAAPHIRAVIHAHSPSLWRNARELRLPITDPAAANGTPAMARAIERCWRDGVFAERGVLAMGGHEDGVLACGRSVEKAGLVLLEWLARALIADSASR